MVSLVSMVSIVKKTNLNDIGLEKRCEENEPGLPFQCGMPYHADKYRQMEAMMTSAVIKWVLVGSFVLQKAYDMLVRYLDDSQKEKGLPDNVRDVYSDEEYAKFRAYKKDCSRTSLARAIITALMLLAFLVFDVYARVFAWAGDVAPNKMYIQYLIAVAVFVLIALPIDIPFDYYETFVIEERYGMNKTTKKTFWADVVKSTIVNAILNFGLLAMIAFLFSRFGNTAILWASMAAVAFVLIFNMLAVPLMRIFNKFTPLEEGELRDKLQTLCDSYGVKVKKIVIRDASRRTTKANAFCTGIKRKTISLDDNLVNNFTTDEIVAVFAHEFAHARFRHILKSLPFALATIVLTIAGIGIVLNFPALFTAFGFTEVNYYFASYVPSLLIWPLSLGLGTVSNYLSRKHEYEADSFAARQGYGEALVSALKKLTKESLSQVNPHPWIVATEYSHPTLSQRIAAVKRIESELS